jgi:hypothetical protein
MEDRPATSSMGKNSKTLPAQAQPLNHEERNNQRTLAELQVEIPALARSEVEVEKGLAVGTSSNEGGNPGQPDNGKGNSHRCRERRKSQIAARDLLAKLAMQREEAEAADKI